MMRTYAITAGNAVVVVVRQLPLRKSVSVHSLNAGTCTVVGMVRELRSRSPVSESI